MHDLGIRHVEDSRIHDRRDPDMQGQARRLCRHQQRVDRRFTSQELVTRGATSEAIAHGWKRMI